jgi:hypothetical protein
MFRRTLMFHIGNVNTRQSIYCAYFHSVIKVGILFWGNSSNIGKILTLAKKIVTTASGSQPRTSRSSLFTHRFYLFYSSTHFNQRTLTLSVLMSYIYIYIYIMYRTANLQTYFIYFVNKYAY